MPILLILTITIGRGGSKINGNCDDATLNTESQSVTLIYVDGTKVNQFKMVLLM